MTLLGVLNEFSYLSLRIFFSMKDIFKLCDKMPFVLYFCTILVSVEGYI